MLEMSPLFEDTDPALRAVSISATRRQVRNDTTFAIMSEDEQSSENREAGGVSPTGLHPLYISHRFDCAIADVAASEVQTRQSLVVFRLS
jgi:hypothetical protein